MKNKSNIASIIGFVFSVILVIPVVCAAFFAMLRFHNVSFYRMAMKLAMGAVFVGFIASLTGVITARKNNGNGKKLAVIGLSFSILEIIVFIAFLAIVFFWIGSGVQMSN